MRAPRRLVAALAVVTVVLVGGAEPAAADPAGPTDYRAVLDDAPATEAATIEVVGGDSFLLLDVDPGHEAQVEGYSGEPYLRFLADGTVEENRSSPATYLNEDRYGGVPIPSSASAKAEPVWEEVASDGSYAWHDHRIHWMSPDSPPEATPGEVVQEWTIPFTVDGEPVAATGELLLEPGPNPLPTVAALAVAGGLAVVAGRHRQGLAGAVAGAGAGALALVVGFAERAVAPEVAPATPLLVILPAVALLLALAGLALRGTWRVLGTVAAVGALGGWVLSRLAVLWSPVLPTGLPDVVDRSATAAVIGLAAAAALLAVRSGELEAAPVEIDSPTDEPTDAS